jgi:hypothetical protein
MEAKIRVKLKEESAKEGRWSLEAGKDKDSFLQSHHRNQELAP